MNEDGPRDRAGITARSDVAQRRKVEDAMSPANWRGVVCTSSLDLGVDWGDVDLVINVGAPKGAPRLMQRTAAPIIASTKLRAPCWYGQPV